MDLTYYIWYLLLGIVIGWLIKPVAVTQTLSVYSATISYFPTKVVTTTATSYVPRTPVVSTVIYTSEVPVFKTVTNTVVSYIASALVTTTQTTVLEHTVTATVTVYSQEMVKESLPYLGPTLVKMYKLLKRLEQVYGTMSSKSNPIVENFRKAMQARVMLVARITNLRNDLNLLVRYYVDLINSDKVLAHLMKQELNYNNVYKGYMYLFRMNVDISMIKDILAKIKTKITSLHSDMPAVDMESVKKVVGNPENFLLEVAKSMTLKEALPLLERAKKAGGPRAVVDAYLAQVISDLDNYYSELISKWKEANTYFIERYVKYYKTLSSVPS